MVKKRHGEEYEEARDGAITYLSKDMNDDIITAYQNSKDPSIKQGITVLINQRNSQRKVFLNSMKEFDELKNSIENENKNEEGKSKDLTIEENVNEQGDGEITVNVDNKDEYAGKNSNDGDNNNENSADEKDLDTKIKELDDKANEMEKLGEALLLSDSSVNMMKNSFMKNCKDAGIIMEARIKYENAQDVLALETAKHMVQKNILVAKREAVILEINRAIGRGDNLDSLQNNLIDLNNQIEDLDRTFDNVFPMLQKEVTNAHNELKEASKEVMKSVKADFRNSYKQIRNYSEDGILQNETIDMNVEKNNHMNRVAMATTYDDSILSNGKNGAIDAQTININGQIIRVVSRETSMGVDTSFMDGNTVQMETGVGQNNTYVTRDNNGNLIADNPDVKDTLERIGIENVNDIGKACEEMDEKADKREKEEIDEEEEYPYPSLNTNDEE